MKTYTEIFEHRGHEYNQASLISATARQTEVDALLNLLSFRPDLTIVDVPAGGGFVAKRIEARALPHQQVICVEPAKQFAAAIPAHFTVLNEEVDALSLEDNSVDVVSSLAGLHHIENRMPIYQQWHRVLRPGGRLVIADVKEHTATAQFLNGFVNQYNSSGHEGLFIRQGEFELGLVKAGFSIEHNQLTDVRWHFDNQQQMGEFCKSLFAIDNASVAQVIQVLTEDVGISEDNRGVDLHWQLQYACGFKK
ncbi:MAG: ubiquinone/menaquinone biosynthesis C-methylase UbiE [Phenylobacterium sp.]|jgi:ubiquinone/menaquinone biosynthesis C-methylase UbiE